MAVFEKKIFWRNSLAEKCGFRCCGNSLCMSTGGNLTGQDSFALLVDIDYDSCFQLCYVAALSKELN
jgi:hypothetical protein